MLTDTPKYYIQIDRQGTRIIYRLTDTALGLYTDRQTQVYDYIQIDRHDSRIIYR
jgi:hypothetical protein